MEILADSELIVRQIDGRYRCKNPNLKPLFAEARRLIARFASFKLTHVPRKKNSHADRLVNVALDSLDQLDAGAGANDAASA